MARTDDTATGNRTSTGAAARRDSGLRRVRRVTRWVTSTAAAGLVALGGAYAHGESAVAASAPAGGTTSRAPAAPAHRAPAPSAPSPSPAPHHPRTGHPPAGHPRTGHHRTGHPRHRLTPAAPPSPGVGTSNTTSGAS